MTETHCTYKQRQHTRTHAFTTHQKVIYTTYEGDQPRLTALPESRVP